MGSKVMTQKANISLSVFFQFCKKLVICVMFFSLFCIFRGFVVFGICVVTFEPLTGSVNSNWYISDQHFFMIRWHYDKKEDIFEIPFSFVITISTYLKNPVSCFTDFSWPYSNERENKNNIASCLWSISDRINASTEKNIYFIWKHQYSATLSPRDKGVACPWGPHTHIPSKFLYLFFLRSWRPCEVDEVKK